METESAQLFQELEDEVVRAIRGIDSFTGLSALQLDMHTFTQILAIAIFNISMLGRAQVTAATAAKTVSAIVLTRTFAPLPFDEAITFFREKVSLSPTEFHALTDAAKAKAFHIADGANTVIREQIRQQLDRALSQGVTLREFQRNAAEIASHAGVAARAPWYWQTVYRTNLQESYQVGRWKQMTDPGVAANRPYLRYVSALLPTTRPSHAEKHGLIYPINHAFWQSWAPPAGFNCYCSLTSVSPELLASRHWTVSDDMNFRYPNPDPGFGHNAALSEEI